MTSKMEIPIQWTYQLIFGQDNLKRSIVQREIVIKNGNTLINRPNEQDRLDPVLFTQTAMEQVKRIRRYRGYELVKGYG